MKAIVWSPLPEIRHDLPDYREGDQMAINLIRCSVLGAHVTRVTLTRGSDRVEIQNEVTQNFGGTQLWRFSLNVTSPDVRHEEVGAIARARLTTNGGSYSPRNARYDYLTLNHFADMTGAGSVGMTLSNVDAYFMKVGGSSVTNLDTTNVSPASRTAGTQ